MNLGLMPVASHSPFLIALCNLPQQTETFHIVCLPLMSYLEMHL